MKQPKLFIPEIARGGGRDGDGVSIVSVINCERVCRSISITLKWKPGIISGKKAISPREVKTKNDEFQETQFWNFIQSLTL